MEMGFWANLDAQLYYFFFYGGFKNRQVPDLGKTTVGKTAKQMHITCHIFASRTI